MMKKINFSRVLPYAAGILLFLIITMVYFSPLLEGKKMLQSDIIHFKGMSKEIVDFREKTGTEPLWTNSMFGGMPAYQISVLYKANLLGFIDNILKLGLPHPANLVFLYFLGFFILLLVMRVNPWLAIAGAIAFAFSSYFFIILEAGHNSKAHAIGYMAFVIAGVMLILQKKYLWGGLVTSVFLSLELKANHPQITYYLVLLLFLLGAAYLVEVIRTREYAHYMKFVGIMLVAGSFALLTNITSLWATYEYGNYTIRGKSELTTEQHNRTSGLDKDYATQWSYGVGETMTLLIPNVYGGSSNMKMSGGSAIKDAMKQNGLPEETISQYSRQQLPFFYWGAQPFTSGPVYVGAIMVFLFVLGLIVVKGPLKWWLAAGTVLSIMLAWGHNFMAFTDFFLEYVPGYNKFRAVTMILVIAELTIPLLGILAVRDLYENRHERKKMVNALYLATAITGGIALLFAAVPGMFLSFTGSGDALFKQQYQLPDWFIQAIRDDRARMARIDSLRSLVFILLSAGTLWFLVTEKLKSAYCFGILILLVLVDMFPVNKRFLGDDSFTGKTKVENPYEPNQANNQILADKNDPNFRVLNLTVSTFNDASTSYFHQSIGGYHGAKLRRYQEVIDHSIQPEIKAFARSMSTDSTPVLNMLNTRYFILPGGESQPMAYRNPGALGNAWFVAAIQPVANADEEIHAIRYFRPDSLMVADKMFEDQWKGINPGKDSSDRIILKEYAPNKLIYSYQASGKRLAVFSEIYYPKGWNAYIDGTPAPHFRANYILRAMAVPEGQHTIEFRFEPTVYNTGETISLVSSGLLILLLILGIGYEIMTLRKKTA
jgi:hypothetical protein